MRPAQTVLGSSPGHVLQFFFKVLESLRVVNESEKVEACKITLACESVKHTDEAELLKAGKIISVSFGKNWNSTNHKHREKAENNIAFFGIIEMGIRSLKTEN